MTILAEPSDLIKKAAGREERESIERIGSKGT